MKVGEQLCITEGMLGESYRINELIALIKNTFNSVTFL